jgi:hypothetical protein
VGGFKLKSMICYRNKSKQQSLDVFQEKGSNDLIVYIKSGKLRCKVICSFDTEEAILHKSYRRRKYTKEQFDEIQQLLSYKFDFKIINK